jgi:hypothetical protein
MFHCKSIIKTENIELKNQINKQHISLSQKKTNYCFANLIIFLFLDIYNS